MPRLYRPKSPASSAPEVSSAPPQEGLLDREAASPQPAAAAATGGGDPTSESPVGGGLRFVEGKIWEQRGQLTGLGGVDVVVALHACDTGVPSIIGVVH